MRSKTEEFEKYEITNAQLKISLSELHEDMIPELGKNPTRSDIIKILLVLAANEMSLYSDYK